MLTSIIFKAYVFQKLSQYMIPFSSSIPSMPDEFAPSCLTETSPDAQSAVTSTKTS